MPHILIVDDDPDICSLIAQFLARHGFAVSTAGDGAAMDAALADARSHHQPIELVVLDRMMPGDDGLSIARRLSKDADSPAIIILSAMGEDAHRIEGLDGGADDYLAKPVNPRELLSRIRAVLRRRAPAETAATMVRFGGWAMDLVRRELSTPDGVLVSLTDSEFQLLQELAEHGGEACGREQLVARLHGGSHDTFDRAIDVQISRLRKKLARAGGDAGQHLIRTVRNGGYRLEAAEAEAPALPS